jgi:hypothetical protein
MSYLKVIVIVKLFEITQPDNPLFPAVKVLKCFPRLNEGDFLSALFNDPESLEQFDDYLQK